MGDILSVGCLSRSNFLYKVAGLIFIVVLRSCVCSKRTQHKCLHHEMDATEEVRQQEKKLSCRLLLIFQPLCMLMIGLTAYFGVLIQTYAVLMAKYSWLDDKEFIRPDGIADARLKDELELPGLLRFLAWLTPLWTVGTLIVTFMHVYEHMRPRSPQYLEIRWLPSLSHDLAIQVALLPLVYGLFTFDNVVLALGIFTGDDFKQHIHLPCVDEWAFFNARTEELVKEFDLNFCLADIYEAWALQCFAHLLIVVVQRKFSRNRPLEVFLIEKAKGRLEQRLNLMRDESAEAAALKNSLKKDIHTLGQILEAKHSSVIFSRPLQTMSLKGVQLFVLVCFTNALYSVAWRVFWEITGVDICASKDANFFCQDVPKYLQGMGMLAISVAILNLFIFKKGLNDHLEGFDPMPKFWSIKLLVMVTFWCKLLFGPGLDFFFHLHLSKVQSSLAYTSTLSLFIMLLSIWTYYGWRPKLDDENDWYQRDCYEITTEGETGFHVDFVADIPALLANGENDNTQPRVLETLFACNDGDPRELQMVLMPGSGGGPQAGAGGGEVSVAEAKSARDAMMTFVGAFSRGRLRLTWPDISTPLVPETAGHAA